MPLQLKAALSRSTQNSDTHHLNLDLEPASPTGRKGSKSSGHVTVDGAGNWYI